MVTARTQNIIEQYADKEGFVTERDNKGNITSIYSDPVDITRRKGGKKVGQERTFVKRRFTFEGGNVRRLEKRNIASGKSVLSENVFFSTRTGRKSSESSFSDGKFDLGRSYDVDTGRTTEISRGKERVRNINLARQDRRFEATRLLASLQKQETAKTILKQQRYLGGFNFQTSDINKLRELERSRGSQEELDRTGETEIQEQVRQPTIIQTPGGNPFASTFRQQSISDNELKLAEQERIKERNFKRLDTQLFGLLPGGVSPRNAARRLLKEGDVGQKAFVLSNPALLFEAYRKEARDISRKGTANLISEDSIIMKAPIVAGAEKIGLGDTAPIKFIDKQTKPIGKFIRENPLETAEIVAETVIVSKGLANIGGIYTKGASEVTKLLKINSPTAQYIFTRLPSYIVQNKVLGNYLEKSGKEKGFSDSTSKNIALTGQLLQAEAFGNIEGSIALDRLGKTVLTGAEAFKVKASGGFSEGYTSTQAFFDRYGEKEVLPGFVLGNKDFLPSYKQVTKPGFNTLNNKDFETIQEVVKPGDLNKRIAELQKPYDDGISQKELDEFQNVEFKIEQDGKLVDAGTFSLKSPPKTTNVLKLGEPLTNIAGGGIGIVTAGSFGVFENWFKKTKVGRVFTTGVGYAFDKNEAIGDLLTPIFTPTGGIKRTGAAVNTINIVQQSATLNQVLNMGGTISKTQVEGVFEGNQFKGVQETIQVGGKKPRTAQPDFSFTQQTQQNKPAVKNFDITINKGKSVSLNNVNVPTINEQTSLTGINNNTNTNIINSVYTGVPTTTDTIINLPSITEVTGINNNFQNSLNDTIQITNVITSKFPIIPFFPLSGGGGKGYKPPRARPKRRTKYQASLVAAGLKIYGKPRKNISSLEIRPLQRSKKSKSRLKKLVGI